MCSQSGGGCSSGDKLCLFWDYSGMSGQSSEMRQLMSFMGDTARDGEHGWWWQTWGEEGGGRRRTHWGWSPHHSLGNKPAVYGQLLICWVIIPFYPQLNQQQNNTLHKRRKVAGPQHSIAHSAERERQRRSQICKRRLRPYWKINK